MIQRKENRIKLTAFEQQALELIAAGWKVIGPTPFAWRCLAEPTWTRSGRFVTRRYFPVGNYTQLAALRCHGLVRESGSFRHALNDGVTITAKGRRWLASLPLPAKGERGLHEIR